MAYHDMTQENWSQLLTAHPDGRIRIDGISPGSAAMSLGISRQALHKAIKSDRLDAIRIVNANGTTTAVLIPSPELQRFKRARENS